MSFNCGSAVPIRTLFPGPSDCADGPRGVDLAHSIPYSFGDIEVAAGIERDIGWGRELRFDCRSAVSFGALLAHPRNRRDRARRIDLAHSPVVGVGHVHASLCVHCDTSRTVQLRLSREPAIATESLLPSPCERVNHIGRYRGGSGRKYGFSVCIEG